MVAYLDVNPERLEICAFEKMVDNRDLTVMMNWDSLETTSTDHWGDYSFKEEVQGGGSNLAIYTSKHNLILSQVIVLRSGRTIQHALDKSFMTM